MTQLPPSDFTPLDQPGVTRFLFHPRPSYGMVSAGTDLDIPVADGVRVAGRFHSAGKDRPTILFFHGNGEIVDDYESLGPIYTGMGINFLPVDYRGYGRSTGQPAVSAMMADCHRILAFVTDWMAQRNHIGPLTVMGRSLGSASALELAHHHPDQLSGLIIESGFAHVEPLLRLLGVDPAAIGFRESAGFHHLEKIREYAGPLLIIHAEWDQIIPYRDGRALYEAATTADKTLVTVPGAGHNDVLPQGFAKYMSAIQTLMGKLGNSEA